MTERAPARRKPGGSAVKVVVTGPPAAGKTTLIRTVSEITVLSTDRDGVAAGAAGSAAAVAMDFGRIRIDRDLVLYLFGTSGRDRLDLLWDLLGEGLLGYVLLVDVGRPDPLAEAASILEVFRATARVPYVVAVNRRKAIEEAEEARVRDGLRLEPGVPVVPCDVADRESVKSVLLALLHAVAASLEHAPARA